MGLDEDGYAVIFSYVVIDNYNFTATIRLRDGVDGLRKARILGAEGTDAGILDHHYSCTPDGRVCSIALYRAGGSISDTTHHQELILYRLAERAQRRIGHIPTMQGWAGPGTIAVTNGSTAVAGTGTSFSSDYQNFLLWCGGQLRRFSYTSTAAGSLLSYDYLAGALASGITFSGAYELGVGDPATQYYVTPRCSLHPNLPMALCNGNGYLVQAPFVMRVEW